jgi:hypothetical protein
VCMQSTRARVVSASGSPAGRAGLGTSWLLGRPPATRLPFVGPTYAGVQSLLEHPRFFIPPLGAQGRPRGKPLGGGLGGGAASSKQNKKTSLVCSTALLGVGRG